MKKILTMIMIFTMILAACSNHSEEKSTTSEGNSASMHDNAQEPSAGMAEVKSESKMTRPPNGAEYDQMYFKHYGTNPFVATEEDVLSTFAMDVDTGSYTVMRNYIQRGTLPPNEAVRVEEVVNYFKNDIKPPKDETFAIQVDGGPSPYGEGYHLMRVGIKGKEIKVENRKDANLIFVIDISGSMDRENRLDLVKKSLRLLVEELNPRDKVGIVVYGSRGRVVLKPTSIDEKDQILSAISSLQPGGSTNAEEGLEVGYRMAREYFNPSAINRVILCSDGVANVGKTGDEGILHDIKEYAADEITLSTLGFGMGNYNDTLMEQLANNGDGNYAYIDSFSEARRIFMEELTGTLQTIAKDAKIQVEFDPEKVERYRLLGYENRHVQDEDFRNDAVDGGEIGSGHSVTALYEVKLKDSQVDSIGEIRLRYKDHETQEVEETSTPLVVKNELNDNLKFLASVAEFAEILRGSYWAEDSTLEQVLKIAEDTATNEKEYAFLQMLKDAVALEKSK